HRRQGRAELAPVRRRAEKPDARSEHQRDQLPRSALVARALDQQRRSEDLSTNDHAEHASIDAVETATARHLERERRTNAERRPEKEIDERNESGQAQNDDERADEAGGGARADRKAERNPGRFEGGDRKAARMERAVDVQRQRRGSDGEQQRRKPIARAAWNTGAGARRGSRENGEGERERDQHHSYDQHPPRERIAIEGRSNDVAIEVLEVGRGVRARDDGGDAPGDAVERGQPQRIDDRRREIGKRDQAVSSRGSACEQAGPEARTLDGDGGEADASLLARDGRIAGDDNE